ncbi:MAG TPA: dienelactone hydrolase family protein, partial [Chloroflexota bacterium]|nr:dienelactone hydrolase family protein [Chloroflexota bacterium]
TTMCFDHRARPPIAPIAGGATDARDLTLTSADGTKFMAYAARATNPTGAGMVVLPDVRGLHQYYKELVLRFAENGVDAIALDYFGRTDSSNDRGESFDWMPHVMQTKDAQVQADVAATVAHLRSAEGGNVRALFSVGFCFGGALSFNQAASGLGYAGVIGFYGWPLGLPIPEVDRPRPIDSAAQYKAAVLAIYGEADQGIPPDAIQQFDAALDAAGVEHETHSYANAPHSFFDRQQEQFAEASADSWERVKAFIAKHT